MKKKLVELFEINDDYFEITINFVEKVGG